MLKGQCWGSEQGAWQAGCGPRPHAGTEVQRVVEAATGQLVVSLSFRLLKANKIDVVHRQLYSTCGFNESLSLFTGRRGNTVLKGLKLVSDKIGSLGLGNQVSPVCVDGWGVILF